MTFAALVLAACGSGGEPAATPSPTPSPTPSSPSPTPTPEPVQPLTGLPAPDGVPVRPAIVVKVDNTRNAAPQVGLGAADLVVQEPVEGGLTRLAAIYHSALPDRIAPVRSVRSSDIGIAAPTGGALVASGGAPPVLDQLAAAGVPLVTPVDAQGFSRDPARRAPYDVVVRPAEVLATAAALQGLSPPPPYLPWADAAADLPAGTQVSTVDVAFSRGSRARWTTTANGWALDGDLAAEGDRFTPATLLVLRVTTRDAGYLDPAGNPVPEVVLAGAGEALLVHGTQAVTARWSRGPEPAAPLLLTGLTGAPLHVPPGRTWVGLVPEAGSVHIS
ncbi:MAG TPA: DUF3048 domain-containing protein [Jiangellales bacterium]|nr:DUF3048 domain-containing protein [Jiangellales bacterium]